jgi:hypothetical protein
MQIGAVLLGRQIREFGPYQTTSNSVLFPRLAVCWRPHLTCSLGIRTLLDDQ